jgi:hypothetical protein
MCQFPFPNRLVSSVSEHEHDRRKTQKFEDQRCFEACKILKGDKEPMEKNSKPNTKVAKTEMFSFGNRSVWFFQIK